VLKKLSVRPSRSRITKQFGLESLRLIGAHLVAATAAFLGAWDMLLQRDVIIAVIAALAAGYGVDTLKSAARRWSAGSRAPVRPRRRRRTGSSAPRIWRRTSERIEMPGNCDRVRCAVPN